MPKNYVEVLKSVKIQNYWNVDSTKEPVTDLALEECNFHIEDEVEFGYRFIWYVGGKKQCHRGQTCIPKFSDIVSLIQKAIEDGWLVGS